VYSAAVGVVKLGLSVPLNDNASGSARNQLFAVFYPFNCKQWLGLFVLALGDELGSRSILVIAGLCEEVGIQILAE
jgi:hypothetical protein